MRQKKDSRYSAPMKLTKTIRSKKRIVAEWICGLLGFSYFLFYWENNVVQTSRFVVESELLPRAFDRFKIVQVSDLHGKIFGLDSRSLFDKIRSERPNIIVITGDLIDERRFDLEYARDVVRKLSRIAPVFYVTGNHEGNFVAGIKEQTLDAIQQSGATMLDERSVELTFDSNGALVFTPKEEGDSPCLPDSILLAGTPDPIEQKTNYRIWVDERLARIPRCDEQFGVLLAHRPDLIDSYAKRRFDLVFSGHAHGGQFRVPFLLPNGLYAPNQGFFPKYTNGLYRKGRTTEIVSRGLGPSVIPTRIFNRPNLVVCELRVGNA